MIRAPHTYYERSTVTAIALLAMTQKNVTSFRLSADQMRKLEKLSKKLGVTRANVLRIAINRLAELEGVR